MLLYTVIATASYLALSLLVHHYLMPLEKIEYNHYFKPGDTFNSISEGFNQTVLSQDGDWLGLHLEVQPHAPGPLEHIHNDFDETFTVKHGVLKLLVICVRWKPSFAHVWYFAGHACFRSYVYLLAGILSAVCEQSQI